MSNLQNEIGNLSAVEKFDLLDALWESLEADELSLTDAQRDELD
jgi:putative addiction module component (TIGR02574 family)